MVVDVWLKKCILSFRNWFAFDRAYAENSSSPPLLFRVIISFTYFRSNSFTFISGSLKGLVAFCPPLSAARLLHARPLQAVPNRKFLGASPKIPTSYRARGNKNPRQTGGRATDPRKMDKSMNQKNLATVPREFGFVCVC